MKPITEMLNEEIIAVIRDMQLRQIWNSSECEKAIKFLRKCKTSPLESKIPSEWAYRWVRYIGDKDIMRERITGPFWKKEFREYFDE